MSPPEPLFDRVLLSNDDGIDAPGLAVLEQVAGKLAREVWIVAPAEDQSGTSHSLSLHSPLRVAVRGERRFAVRGTPADCVALAMGHLLGSARPDLILSGINRGANIGVETVFSGTIGAAMMGVLLGIPAIALSQTFVDRQAVPWDNCASHAETVIRQLVAAGWSQDACLNVNFPPLPAGQTKPLAVTRQGAGLLRGVDVISGVDPRDIAYHWLRLQRSPGKEVADAESEALAAGHITVSPLRFERTHLEEMERLKRKLNGS